MNIFKYRYFFICCVAAIITSTLSFFAVPFVKLTISLLAVVVSMTAMLIYISKRELKGKVIITIMLCISIFLSSFSSYIFYDASYSAERTIIGEEVEISALVLGEEYNSSNMSGYAVKVESVDGESKSYLAMLDCKYISDVRAGDRIVAKVVAVDFENSLNGYSEKQSRLSDGYFMSFESASEEDYTIIERDIKSLRILSQALNFRLSYMLRKAVGGEEGNLAAAIFLGSKQYISDITERDFARSGASHLLALSGMHMAIIMGALSLILKLFRTPKIVRAILLIIISVSYYALTGMSMSATRSLIMLLCVYLSMIFSYKSDSLTSLSFAGACILISMPAAVLDIGFWMSFSATFGILVFSRIFTDIYQRIKAKSRIVRIIKRIAIYIIGLFTTSLCAFIGLVLVICIFTKEFSPFSFISSAALTLPVSCIIICSLCLPLLSFISPIRGLLLFAIRESGEFCRTFCADISKRNDAIYSINYDFLVYFALAFAVALIVTLIVNFKRKYLVFLVYAPIIAGFILTVGITNINHIDEVNITYLNTSSNSDIIVISNENRTVICDMSNGSSKALSSAVDIAREARSTEIEAIILSDYHTAHIPTLSKLFKRNIIRNLYVPTPQDSDSYYRLLSILDIARSNGVNVLMFEGDEPLCAFSQVEITLMQDKIDRSQIPISLLSIECNGEKITYFSPAYTEGERADEFSSEIDNSDYLIGAARGPKVKNYFSIQGNESLREIVFAETKDAIYLDTSTLPSSLPIYLEGKIRTYTFYKVNGD